MSEQEKKIAKLEALLKLVDESITKEEFIKAFQGVLDFVLKARADFEVMYEKHSEILNALYEKFSSKLGMANQSEFDTIKSKIEKALQDQQNGMNFIYDKVRKIKDGKTPTKEELLALINPLIPPPIQPKELLPETPEQVANKLNTLEETIEQNVIKGLEAKFKELKESIINVGTRRVVAGPSANAIGTKYFTGDGTKSYAVPRHRKALMLIGTQGPIVFTEIEDFTTANTTLTLTANVSDVVGQKYVFLYTK